MNVWLSSASNHQWYPSQKQPATPWEAEIDRLMQAQASTVNREKRKVLFDKVQEIVWEQAPFIYLANKNSLSALSPNLQNAAPAMIRPQAYWNAESLILAAPQVARNIQ
jgi:peptide/nickel transport system substrate-binding protein